MRIRHFGLLMLVLVGLAPLLIAGLLVVQRAERTDLASIRTGELRAATLTASQLDRYVGDQQALLQSIGATVGPSAQLTTDQRTRIARMYRLTFRQLTSIELYGPDADCKQIGTGRLDDALHDGCTPAITTALRGETYRSAVTVSKQNTPTMTLAVPLEIAGQRVGVVVADVDMSVIWDVLHDLHIGATGYARLVEDDGTLIGHGNAEEQRHVFLRDTTDPHLAAALAAGSSGTRYRDSQGREVFAVAHHLDTLPWTVIVEQPIAEAFAPARAMRRALYILIAVAVALALLAGVLVGRGPVRTLEQLREQVNEFAKGKLDAKGPEPSIEELQQLAASLNNMARSIVELQEERESNVRLATFASVAAGLAHDLKAPIMRLRSVVIAAEKAETPEQAKTELATANERDLPLLERYLEDTYRLARTGKVALDLSRIDVRELADEVIARFAGDGRFRGVTFTIEGRLRPLIADRRLLVRALTNLVDNAAYASSHDRPPGGKVAIELADSTNDSTNGVVIAVRDTGPGLTAARLREILKHHFRSDKHSNGVGLGLGVVKQVASMHEGQLEAESEQGVGSVFRLRLPRLVEPRKESDTHDRAQEIS
jgi:signal transduction histidine kinase